MDMNGTRWIDASMYGFPDKVANDQGYVTQSDKVTVSPVVTGFDEWVAQGSYQYNWWMKSVGRVWYDTIPFGQMRATRKAFYDANIKPPRYTRHVNASEAFSNGQDPARRRKATDTGISLTEPELYETVDLHGDSSTATVMSMATGYDLPTYKRFVGGLRKTGFKGRIILAVDEDVHHDKRILEYFAFRNVTFKTVETVNYTDCVKTSDSYPPIIRYQPCSKKYPHLKATWARHYLFRDWLAECETCTGPVLYVDSRDTYFQDDPFGPNTPPVTGLQVYEMSGGGTCIPALRFAVRSKKKPVLPRSVPLTHACVHPSVSPILHSFYHDGLCSGCYPTVYHIRIAIR